MSAKVKEIQAKSSEFLLEESTTPAGHKNKEISNDTLSFCDALKESTKMAAFIVIGTFFHPVYSITNNIVLGHNAD